MKLKHLFLASLAVCAFASCSDDSSNGIDIPEENYQEIETSLSISAIPQSDVVTKASTVEPGDLEDGTLDEQFVNSLTAILFDAETKAFAASKTVYAKDNGGKTLTSIEDIVVKVKAQEAGEVSNSKFIAILIANIADIPTPASYDAFLKDHFEGITNYTFDKVNSTDNDRQYLPMSSDVIKDITGLVAGIQYDNWIESDKTVINTTQADNKKVEITNNKVVLDTDGSPKVGASYATAETKKISLVRNVARVQLESLTANFTNNYSKVVFELTKVSLANVSNASKYCADEANGSFAHIIDGDGNGAYNKTNAFYRGYPTEFPSKKFPRADYYLALGTQDDAFLKTYTDVKIDNVSGSGNEETITFKDGTTVATDDKVNTTKMAQFYAFECDGYDINQDEASELAGNTAYTLLIITGKFTGIGDDKERSFRIPIRHSASDYGVKRNYIYKVNATLTGIGTPNPDATLLNACMSFSIKVEPWNVIKQTETDVN